jgi:radical SAM modification target selenobiotic family peptide
MDISEIKKAVAGLCIAGLVSGAGLTFATSS